MLLKSYNHLFKACFSPSLEEGRLRQTEFSIYLVEQLFLQFALRIFKSLVQRYPVILLVVAIRVRSFLQSFAISGTSPPLGYCQFGIRVKYRYHYKRPPLPYRPVTIGTLMRIPVNESKKQKLIGVTHRQPLLHTSSRQEEVYYNVVILR